MANAVYPGSFDPIHNGHVDVITRGSKVFDRLIVGVYDVPPKRLLFTTEERADLARRATSDLANVEVVSFSGLAVDFARDVGASFILRGLRAGVRLRDRVRDGSDVEVAGSGYRRRVHYEYAGLPVSALEQDQGGSPARRRYQGLRAQACGGSTVRQVRGRLKSQEGGQPSIFKL